MMKVTVFRAKVLGVTLEASKGIAGNVAVKKTSRFR